MVERVAVNHLVAGSSPAGTSFFRISLWFFSPAFSTPFALLVASLVRLKTIGILTLPLVFLHLDSSKLS